MFDLGWAELFVISIVALIVIGPRDLPQTMRMVSKWVRKARSMAREFQSSIEELAKQADLDEVKAEIKAMADFNPEAELQESLDPGGKISASLPKASDIYDEIDDADGKTEALPTAMDDIQDALDEADDFTETEVEAVNNKEPDPPAAPAAQAANGDKAAGADQPAAAADAEDETDDARPAGDGAPLGTVMGPVPAEAKAKAGARRA